MADTNSQADVPAVSDTQSGNRPVAEAKQHLETATEQPERAVERRARLVELLSVSTAHELETRATASGALTIAARTDPGRVAESIPGLIDELATELQRAVPEESPQRRALSRATRNQLVSSIGHVLADSPGRVAGVEEFSVFTDAVSTDLEAGAMRAAAQGLFMIADEHPAGLAGATDSLGAVVRYPDNVVQSLGAGTLGRLLEDHPDAVAPQADGLRALLGHDDRTVQHNAVEALATLCRTHPDAVVAATDQLRELLDHDEVALQHNAAGTLGQLADTHPTAVRPAVGDLRALQHHDDEAVRHVATRALAGLSEDSSG
jgi:hypothetical protein